MSAASSSSIPDPPWAAAQPSDAPSRFNLLQRAQSGPGPVLRAIVLATVATMLLLSLGLAWWIMHSMQESVLDQALPLQTQAVEQMGRTMALRLEQQQKPLLALAPVVAQHMGASAAAREALLSQPGSIAGLFEQVQLADAQGQLLLNLHAGQARPLAAVAQPVHEALRRGLVEGKPVVQAWLHNESEGTILSLQHVVPLRGPEGQLLGVLGASSRTSAQLLMPLDAAADGRGSLLLLDRDGKILARSEQAGWKIGDAVEEGLQDWAGDWLRVAQTGTVSERRGMQLWSAVPLPWVQWTLVWVSDVQDWTPGLERHEQWAMGGTVLAVAFIWALAVILIAHPLTEIFRRAERALQRQVVDATQAGVRGANWWQRLPEHDWGEARTLRLALQALGRSREVQDGRELQLQLQMQALMDYAPVGLVVTQSSRILRVGMQAARILGYAPRELQGMAIRRLCPTQQVYEQLMQRVSRDLDIYGQFDSETSLRRKDGSTVWVRIHGQSMQRLRRGWEGPKREGSEDFLVWEVEDVTTQRLVREHSSWKALHDPLTRLPNRAAFAMRLQEWLQECTEALGDAGEDCGNGAGGQGVILYLDLDHFAQVNLQGGRKAGDEVLSHIARLVETLVRPLGWAARVGGDEFAVLLPAATQEQGMRVAQLLCMAVQDWEGAYEDRSFLMGVSIGLLVLDARRHSVDAALKAVDMACYAAKRKGRNRVEVMTRPV